MVVMYANALYKRGYAKEGYKVLQTLLNTAMNFEVSKMYPGIPEYFDNDGRGLYAYLTGAASWYMLTMITEVFGVKGELGNLVIAPALMPEQFDENGKAVLELEFAEKKFKITISNPQKKEISKITAASCGEISLTQLEDKKVCLEKKKIQLLSKNERHEIFVETE